MTNYARDPEKGYRGADLWLPKKHLNTKAVTGALTFQPDLKPDTFTVQNLRR